MTSKTKNQAAKPASAPAKPTQERPVTPPPPPPRTDITVRVRTRRPGQRRSACGVVISGEWKHLVVDDRGSAYKALMRDPDIIVERQPDTPPAPESEASDKDDADA